MPFGCREVPVSPTALRNCVSTPAGGSGQVKTRVEIARASDGSMLCRTNDCVLTFGDRNATVHARYALTDVTFPEPGFYLVELFCEDEFVEDQRIQILGP
jgi:hypothetical protein